MDTIATFEQYYRGDIQSSDDVARNAYIIARAHLEHSTSLKEHEKALLFDKCSIEDAQQVVADSIAECETKHDTSKARKWLHKASELICHYGIVLDVFVQHHPEYVSLIWGLWKLLFTSVLNHGETLRILAKAITQIGQRLPRIQIASKLYPTRHMKTALESIYVEILSFLMKAHGWCKESLTKRIYHSITRPPAIQYGDILEKIETCSNNITEIATLASHAELRVMHTSQRDQLEDIISKLEATDRLREERLGGLRQLLLNLGSSHAQLESKVDLILTLLRAAGVTMNDLLVRSDSYHSIQMNAHLNTNDQLTDMQLAQALSALSSSFQDPYKCFQRHLLLRKRRTAGIATAASTNEFWSSPRLESFSSSRDSNMVIVKGTFTLRAAMKDFGVDAIRALTRSEITTVWALEGADKEKNRWNSADLLRYLTWQVLRTCKLTEKHISMRYSQFQTAQTSRDWMRLFIEVVKHVGGQLYLIVDLAVMQASLATADGFNIINEFNGLIRSSAQEGNFVLKIIVLTYDNDWHRILPSELGGSLIAVKKATSRKLPRKQNRNLRFSKA